MTVNDEQMEIYTLLFAAISVFLILASFIIYFVLLYRRRQQKTIIEKKEIKLHYEAELLKTHIEVQEQTMQTIAADLHDNIGQLLSLTALTLNSINLKEPQKLEKKITESIELVNDSIKELRGLAKLMHGELIIQTGLGNAIKQELDRLKKIGNYKLKVKNDLINANVFSPNKDLVILRLLQEIINNIIKHAKAGEIEVKTYLKEEKVYLMIKDNGVGFDMEEIRTKNLGMGLNSMFKRVNLINGKISIDSTAPIGTSISIEIPYP